MQSLSFFELQDLAHWLQIEMEGAQLQDLWTNGQLIVFQFYKFKEIYLVVETDNHKPLMVYLEEAPPVQKKSKPLILFLNSKAKNLRWGQCTVDPNKGRVLDIQLTGGNRECRIEFQMIPKNFNILAESEGKKISWEKPRELPPAQIPNEVQEGSRDWVEVGRTWAIERFQTPKTEKKAASDPRYKALEKKKRALEAIAKQLQEDSATHWRELGESLKISSEVPEHLALFYNSKESRTWNLEHAFSQAKLAQKKRAGTEERMQKVQEEIAFLEKDLNERPEAPVSEVPKSSASRLLEKTQSKGRRIQLDGGFEALMGKSAQDNLAILRKAQAWDLWMHLKDYPGSHAIVIRPRNKEVPTQVLQKVSEWLIRESLGSQKIQWGTKYDVVVVECRYVRPIKGDRLGRVTYHNPQVYSFASKS